MTFLLHLHTDLCIPLSWQHTYTFWDSTSCHCLPLPSTHTAPTHLHFSFPHTLDTFTCPCAGHAPHTYGLCSRTATQPHPVGTGPLRFIGQGIRTHTLRAHATRYRAWGCRRTACHAPPLPFIVPRTPPRPAAAPLPILPFTSGLCPLARSTTDLHLPILVYSCIRARLPHTTLQPAYLLPRIPLYTTHLPPCLHHRIAHAEWTHGTFTRDTSPFWWPTFMMRLHTAHCLLLLRDYNYTPAICQAMQRTPYTEQQHGRNRHRGLKPERTTPAATATGCGTTNHHMPVPYNNWPEVSPAGFCSPSDSQGPGRPSLCLTYLSTSRSLYGRI